MYLITENSESKSLRILIKNEIDFLIKNEINNFDLKSITIVINETEKEVSDGRLKIINDFGQNLLDETLNQIEVNKLSQQEILSDYFDNLI